jgi:hypothetical protein
MGTVDATVGKRVNCNLAAKAHRPESRGLTAGRDGLPTPRRPTAVGVPTVTDSVAARAANHGPVSGADSRATRVRSRGSFRAHGPTRVTLDEAILLVRAHVEGQFPKACTNCPRVFASLPEYLRGTRHVGQPVSYDAELGDWEPREPIGVHATARCSCGTSLSISSSGMSLVTLGRLMVFARGETRRRGIKVAELLALIRDAIDRQVLAEHDAAQANL